VIDRLRLPLRITFVLFAVSFPANSQTFDRVDLSTDSDTGETSNKDLPWLRKGMNELGVWCGGAFQATTIFGGLHADEARDRRFVVAAFRYGRTLAANRSVALEYTLDAVPLALATGDIVSSTTVGTITTFVRKTAYGAGLTPLGLHVDFANSGRVHPFIHVNGGFLIFNRPVPLPDAGKFAFVGEAGSGLRIFTSEKRALILGVKFHHISNGDRSGSNRGLNQFVIYTGFSFFK
jgi:hypothetical protein